MMLLLEMLLMWLGFAGLALALDRHYRQLWQQAPSRWTRVGLRGFGWSALSASAVVSIGEAGIATGLVQWVGGLAVAALSLALMLNYQTAVFRVLFWPCRPRRLAATRQPGWAAGNQNLNGA